MRHGHFMGYGYNGYFILIIVLIVAVVVFIALIRDYVRRKNNPENNRLLEILKERYVKSEIDADEYRERSMVLEHKDWACSSDISVVILKERYAKGEIDSKEFVERMNEIQSRNTAKSAMDILKERYAKGEISTEEFKQKKKELR